MKRTNFINKKISEQSGITLIALVLTIIILLILAGVAIATLTGDNGLLTKAGEARNTTIEAEGLEKIKLAVIASHDENGINTTSLAKNLSEINGLTDTNNQVITEITLPKSVKLNNIKYKIKEDGTVIINNSVLPDEYEQVEYIESTGTQYIDTKKVANYNYKIQIDCYIPFSSYTDYGWLFGSRIRINTSPWSKNGIAICINNQGIRYDFGNITNNSYTYQQDGRKNIIIDNTGGYCNGVKLIDFSNAIFTDSELSGNMLLCALLDTGNYFDVRNKNWYDWKNIFLQYMGK